jgi:hypothetical protein
MSPIYLCDAFFKKEVPLSGSYFTDPEGGGVYNKASVILHEAVHLYTPAVDVGNAPVIPHDLHEWSQRNSGAATLNATNYEYQALFSN